VEAAAICATSSGTGSPAAASLANDILFVCLAAFAFMLGAYPEKSIGK